MSKDSQEQEAVVREQKNGDKKFEGEGGAGVLH